MCNDERSGQRSEILIYINKREPVKKKKSAQHKRKTSPVNHYLILTLRLAPPVTIGLSWVDLPRNWPINLSTAFVKVFLMIELYILVLG